MALTDSSETDAGVSTLDSGENGQGPPESPQLIRGVGLASATTLNMIDMIGVGPFITIPAIIFAM